MRLLCALAAALLLASTAVAIQEGATGAGKARNGSVDVGTVDAGDSASGTTRVANKNTITPRRADTCSAQTDGVAGEFCLDDVGGLWQCPQASAPCNASGWQLAGAGALVPSSQTLTSASTQITGTTSYLSVTLTPSGTTTLTATPTIATSGVRQGHILALFNDDATATDCAVLRDKSLLASSGLSLRASSRTLCPGDGGLFLAFNGTDWVEINAGTIRVREGTNDKGLLSQLDFAAGDFEITGKVVALVSDVTRLENTIEPNETTGPFAFLDTAQTFLAAQIIEPSLRVRKADDTVFLDCGNAATDACRYTGAYANDDDIATRGDVNARTTLTFSIYTALKTINDLGTRQYYVGPSAGTDSGLSRQPMPIACTAGKLYVRQKGSLFEANSPTGNTMRFGFRKNTSDTGAVTCDMTAGTGTCSNTGTTLAFAAGDTFSWYGECINAGTACTDGATSRLFAAVFVCEAP